MSSTQPHITFVIAVNDLEILRRNFLASPCLHPGHPHEILLQDAFPSAALAYNHAIRRASNDLLIFIHQDVYLPEMWISRLHSQLESLEESDPEWGVAGCWGATQSGQYVGHIYSTGLGVLGGDFEKPIPVQTLDETVLICKKSSGLRFDASLPNFHFYGTDLCLRSASRHRRCYAISDFCIHNTRQLLALPSEFYESYSHIKTEWTDQLPIQTTCIRVSRSETEVYKRKLQDVVGRFLHPRRRGADRVPDPAELLSTSAK